MNSFHNVRFPGKLAIGASGGPERRTEIVSLSSGKEVRNAVWSHSRRRWDLATAMGGLADLYELIAFFEARQGRLYSFRFKDPLDYLSVAPGQTPSSSDQILGVGDDTTSEFQLVKAYGLQMRKITKPVSNTIRVALNDVDQTTGWTLNDTTGMISFDAPPLSGEVVSAGFEFDCHVRFDADRIDAVVEGFDAGRVVSLNLQEVI